MRKIKPQVKNRDTRLIEAAFKGISVILCYHCYKKRIAEIQVNTSIYQTNRFEFSPRSYRMVYQLASWEKSKCADCGRKNTNPNLEQRELQNYGRPRNPDKAFDLYWQEII